MMNGMDNLEPRRPAWSRPESVFIAASLALLAGFLIPLGPMGLAVAWVCVFCLAGAVTIICLAAGNSTDLIGFVPLISSVVLLRLAALAAAARQIIQHQPPDPLLQTTGLFLAQKWPLGTVLICLLLAAIVSVVVFAASQKILLACTGYIENIFPLKRIGIETDVRMSVITPEQARTMARRIVSEYRFFAGMQGVGTLMRGETAIVVVVLLACVLLPILTAPADGPAGMEFLAQSTPPVVGLAVFTLIPLVIAAAACGAMMGRDTLTLRSEKDPEPQAPAAKKISIVAKDTGSSEEIELLNPDFLNHADATEQLADFEPAAEDDAKPAFQKELESMQNTTQTAADPAEADRPGACEPAPLPEAPTSAPAQWACRNAEDYYEKLSRMILTGGSQRVVLAAEAVGDLPVTVAVNTAIRLAQRQKKILLADTDSARNALARVFDLDPQLLAKKVLTTCFENVSVCTVPTTKIHKLLQKQEIGRQFDLLLVYAPQCAGMKPEAAESASVIYFEGELAGGMSIQSASMNRVPAIGVVLRS